MNSWKEERGLMKIREREKENWMIVRRKTDATEAQQPT